MVKAQILLKEQKRTRSSVKDRDLLKKKILKKKPLIKQKKKDGKPRKVWRKTKTDKGVVYLSHIPHGFYEEQIENYFSQFGKVTELSLPRSKTGKAKGYAFVQFLHPEVAKIAADAMNNYLMFNRVLKAKYVPPEKQKERLFQQAKQTKETNTTRLEMAALKLKKQRSLKNRMIHTRGEAKLARKLLLKCQLTKDQLKELEEEPIIQINKGNVDHVFKREKALIEKKKTTKTLKREQRKETEENIGGKNNSSSEQTAESLLNKTNTQSESEESQKTAPIQAYYNQDLVQNQSLKSQTNKVLTKQNKTNSNTLKNLNTATKTLKLSKNLQQSKHPRQKISSESNLTKKELHLQKEAVLTKENPQNSKCSLKPVSGSTSSTKSVAQKALKKYGSERTATLRSKHKSKLEK